MGNTIADLNKVQKQSNELKRKLLDFDGLIFDIQK